MMDFAFSHFQKTDSDNHKKIARQGIKLNRKENEGTQVSPSGDQPFAVELSHELTIS